MGFWTYIGRRLVTTFPVLVGVTFLVFTILHLAPGDPTVMMLATEWSPEAAERLRLELGLDRPLLVQYLDWLGAALKGDLGVQYTTRQPVTGAIVARLPTTVVLAIGAITLAVLVAIPLGMVSAAKSGSVLDAALRVFALIGLSMPVYWLGILLIMLLAVHVRVFPPGGGMELHGLTAFVLPWTALSTSYAALIMRITRSSALEVLGEDYIRTARAKGLHPNLVHWRHVMKNTLIPVITVVGMQFGGLLGGAVLTEVIFSLPGLGRLMYASVASRDYPMLQGTVLVIAVGFILVNLFVDVLYAAIDPRIRYD